MGLSVRRLVREQYERGRRCMTIDRNRFERECQQKKGKRTQLKLAQLSLLSAQRGLEWYGEGTHDRLRPRTNIVDWAKTTNLTHTSYIVHLTRRNGMGFVFLHGSQVFLTYSIEIPFRAVLFGYSNSSPSLSCLFVGWRSTLRQQDNV